MSLSVGQRLAELRRALGRVRGERLTQPLLAERVGVSRGTVAAWEGDAQQPSGDNLLKLANALESTPEYILNGREQFATPDGTFDTIECAPSEYYPTRLDLLRTSELHHRLVRDRDLTALEEIALTATRALFGKGAQAEEEEIRRRRIGDFLRRLSKELGLGTVPGILLAETVTGEIEPPSLRGDGVFQIRADLAEVSAAERRRLDTELDALLEEAFPIMGLLGALREEGGTLVIRFPGDEQLKGNPQ